jgi:hypothetical protein
MIPFALVIGASLYGLSIWLNKAEPGLNERFTFSIVVDQESGHVLSIYFQSYSPPLDIMKREFLTGAVYKSNEMFDTGKHAFVIGLCPPIPKNDTWRFYEEVFQYELIQWYFMATRVLDTVFVQHERNGTISGARVHVLLLPPNFIRMPGKEVLTALSKNRFVDDPEIKHYWDNPLSWLPMPSYAKLSLPDERSIVIERPKYFKITFMIQPGLSMRGGVPKQGETRGT